VALRCLVVDDNEAFLASASPADRRRRPGGAALGDRAAQQRGSEIGDVKTLLAAIGGVVGVLYVVDVQGRIRFLNAEALEILGYEDERQLRGRPSHETIHNQRPDGTPFPAAECPLLRRNRNELEPVAREYLAE
jgi:PAS domain-containing protein